MNSGRILYSTAAASFGDRGMPALRFPLQGGAAIITSCCAFLFYLNVANRHINYVCMQLFDISMPI